MERSAARELAARPSAPAAARAAASAPVLGEKRTFNVLANGTATGTKPTDYVQVTGTVGYVGTHTAVYLDDAAPAPTYFPDDLQAIGSLFDDHLYPIDTTAFGRESDIDGNGLVLILLTDRVTKLISCSGRLGHRRILPAVRSLAHARRLQRGRGVLRSGPGRQLQPRRAGREGFPPAGRDPRVPAHDQLQSACAARGGNVRSRPGSTRGSPPSRRSWAAGWSRIRCAPTAIA